MQTILEIKTTGSGLYSEFTNDVVRFVRESGVNQGLLTLFVQHTSCSLCIQENADPDVRRDLDEFFRRLVLRQTRPRCAGSRTTWKVRTICPRISKRRSLPFRFPFR